jgi:hypothetical protein
VFILPLNHPKAQHTAWLNQTRSWESDLCDLLLRTVRSPEAKSPPYTGTLSPPKRLLPWLRFAAACALYDPPPEKAPAFADYGGLPLLPGEETQDEPIPGVLTERELREGETDFMVQIAIDYEIFEKVWALRSTLGELDFQAAISAVRNRYQRKLEARQDLLKRHWHGREVGLDSPLYYVPFDPVEDTKKDVDRLVKAINEKVGPAQKAGRKPQDDLLPVLCAVLLEEPGWSPELLASQLELSAKRVGELAREGQALL